jgi:hypothetical protein
MTETKTCLADAVSILEVDEGIFIRGKIGDEYTGGRLALSEAGAINLLLWFKDHRPNLILDVIQP